MLGSPGVALREHASDRARPTSRRPAERHSSGRQGGRRCGKTAGWGLRGFMASRSLVVGSSELSALDVTGNSASFAARERGIVVRELVNDADDVLDECLVRVATAKPAVEKIDQIYAGDAAVGES